VRRWKPLIIWRRPEPSIGTQGIGGQAVARALAEMAE